MYDDPSLTLPLPFPLLPFSSLMPSSSSFLPALLPSLLSLLSSPQQRRVLEELDNRRKEDFKRYEMQMEHKRRMKLKDMDEQKRLQAEEE